MDFSFLRHFFRHPKEVGALAPLSASTARYMTKFLLAESQEKRHILEAGAGMGSVTTHIIPYLQEHDHLDLIDIDENFCRLLEEKFGNDPRISIHCLSILDWNPTYTYDFILSTLPMSSFTKETVEDILEHYQKLASPNALLTYVEYMGLSFFRRILFGRKERDRREVLEEFKHKYLIEKKHNFVNFLPVTIYHLSLQCIE